MGVALSFSGDTADRDELTSWLRGRRELMALAVTALAEDRERLVARGHLGPLEAAVMYRGQLHAETEVRWHDEVARILAAMPPAEPDTAGPGTAEPDKTEPDTAGPDSAQAAQAGGHPAAAGPPGGHAAGNGPGHNDYDTSRDIT